jgi:hypothetical protein
VKVHAKLTWEMAESLGLEVKKAECPEDVIM